MVGSGTSIQKYVAMPLQGNITYLNSKFLGNIGCFEHILLGFLKVDCFTWLTPDCYTHFALHIVIFWGNPTAIVINNCGQSKFSTTPTSLQGDMKKRFSATSKNHPRFKTHQCMSPLSQMSTNLLDWAFVAIIFSCGRYKEVPSCHVINRNLEVFFF